MSPKPGPGSPGRALPTLYTAPAGPLVTPATCCRPHASASIGTRPREHCCRPRRSANMLGGANCGSWRQRQAGGRVWLGDSARRCTRGGAWGAMALVWSCCDVHNTHHMPTQRAGPSCRLSSLGCADTIVATRNAGAPTRRASVGAPQRAIPRCPAALAAPQPFGSRLPPTHAPAGRWPDWRPWQRRRPPTPPAAAAC